jgi:hypothetical protein
VSSAEAIESRVYHSDSWKPAVTAEPAIAAIHAAREVALRLRRPEFVEYAAACAREQTAFPRSTHWIPYTVSQGYAGLALLSSYLDSCFPDEAWDDIGRKQLELAVRSAFSAWQLSRNGTRYRRLQSALDEVICDEAFRLAEHLRAQQDGVTVGDFDAISGLSGVGAYLLCRTDSRRAYGALASILESLVGMILDGEDLPKWHSPAHLLWDEGMKKVYPYGNLNCGLAHGIPGPLALLSLAVRAGVRVPRLEAAIISTARWLNENRVDDDWGINWSTAVPLETCHTAGEGALRPGSALAAPDGASRCAWCYGSPGVARALWLAGDALDCDDYRDLSIAAMEAVFRRPISVRRIDSPTFCHGVAGLLSITMRFANSTGKAIFFEQSHALVQQLLDRYRPESMLGFRNLEVTDREIDQPGLLDGAPGIALALLAAVTDVEPTWDRLFLLS